jgi:two-component system NarL family sensor kinase
MQGSKHQIALFIIISTAIIFLLALLIVTLLFFYQKRQLGYKRNLDQLKLDFEKNLLKAQIEIQEQTFHHISREIHDNINLSLTLAKLNLNTLNWNNLKETIEAVSSSISILSSAIVELSDLSKSMNTQLIREMGLTKATQNEMQRLKELAHLQINYEIKGQPVFMDCEKELVIFRIIQEAFNNILKHSNASTVWVKMDYNNKFLDILVGDNGVGFAKEEMELRKNSGAGLMNMKTRANLFGGEFIIETKPQKGTQILVSVPYYS